MLLKLESESGIRDPNPLIKKSALESGIRIRQIFWRIAIHDHNNLEKLKTKQRILTL